MEKILPKIKALEWRRIILKTAIIIIFGVVLTWLLEYRYFLNDAGRTWQFFWERPLVFWYNSLLMSVMIWLFTGFARGPLSAIGIVSAIIVGVTYAHINKFVMRGTPLLPEDFQLAGETATLTKFVDWGSLSKTIVAIVLILLMSVILEKLTAKYLCVQKKTTKTWWKRWRIPTRALTVSCACLLFVAMTGFARHHTGQKYEKIPWLNSEFVAWNQVRNYNYNGFMLGFLYNLNKFNLSSPDGYSSEKVASIAKKYQKIKKANDKERTPIKKADFNVVVVLNESFYDPAVISDYYHTTGEVVPNLRKIQSKYPSGTMYSTDYGGGTANIEFEVLTGLSNYWVNTVPYTDLLPKIKSIPSMASYLKAGGYKTTAIHPFNGGMYKRDIALKREGFDNYITEKEMKYTEKDGKSQYINDKSAYNEVLKVLKDSKERQMVGLITMQNHTPYDDWIYDTRNFKVDNLADGMDRKSEVEVYFECLHKSDQYLGEFIAELDKMEEKTVVLFFGDHSPGIFSLVSEHEDKKVRDLSRQVPYFVYSNFEMKNEQKNLPMTTPNCLSNTVYDLLGVQKPATHYLLNEICAKTPILTPAYFDEESPFRSTDLSSYEMVIYDLLGGKQYWTRYHK